jgi:hypothetical protein
VWSVFAAHSRSAASGSGDPLHPGVQDARNSVLVDRALDSLQRAARESELLPVLGISAQRQGFLGHSVNQQNRQLTTDNTRIRT